jgi:hypothetical protein
MPRVVVFPPDNQNCPQRREPSAQPYVDALEMFEQERNSLLEVTNLLEALYARLLADPAGVSALTVIED